MPFMVARLLLACDTSYKPLPSLIAKSIADVTQKCAVDPDASIFGSIVNIIYFLVARKTKKITDKIKGFNSLMVFALVSCTLQTHC